MSLATGSPVGPNAIRAPFGRDRMGVVYAANDRRLDRKATINVLAPVLTRDDTAKRRFLQETKAALALDQPHICRTSHDPRRSRLPRKHQS